ncbi:MAG: transposase [Candidatus Roizmanbacteria bacterium]|nr:MAG: transposase [Candidatus Roizmanbacteria bacterium]
MKGFSYSSNGYYFVTICTQERNEWFGDAINGKMVLNRYGETVKKQWLWLEKQFKYVYLDEWIIMPDHFHGIIMINDLKSVGTGRDLSLQMKHKIKSLSELMGVFKTTSSKLIHKTGLNGFHWQRSFYDHIIRNEIELNEIRQYIRSNPSNYDND